MPPNYTSSSGIAPSETFNSEVEKQILGCASSECDTDMFDGGQTKNEMMTKKVERRKLQLVWTNIIAFAVLHLAALYGAWLLLTLSAKWRTLIIVFSIAMISGFGITAGAHRLWAHRTYKAKWPLRLMLMIMNTIAFQDSIYSWARDHRVHHKYSETDADPHDATRGFFFSHMGWLMCKKDPEVLAKGRSLDLSDLEADPIVMFQKRFYVPLMLLGCFIIPTAIPMYFWNETFVNSFFIWTILRWVCTLNATWTVNSAAHAFGYKSYDKSINPAENFAVSFVAMGEGWHNYHHVFPWDYKAAEWGGSFLNVTTVFIDFFAKVGWAYELKSVSKDVIERRVRRTGDGSHPVWGWGDKDLTKAEKDEVFIVNKKTN